MGTSRWGGVLLECGPTEMALVLLPITDAALYAELPAFPPGLIKVVVVCNDHDHGVLAARQVTAKLGLQRVYATDAARPIDRGDVRLAGIPTLRGKPSADWVELEQLEKLTLGPLELQVHAAGAVWAEWSNGTTALVGDAIDADMLVDETPQHVLGRIVGTPPPNLGYVAMETVPTTADEAMRGGSSPAGAIPPADALDQIQFAIITGDLDRGDAVAAAAIARDERVSDMRFQRALIAMMRGDDAAAIRQLEQGGDDPKTATSLCQLYARVKDPRARVLARKALDQLPEDPITIRGAILAHALTGDADGARAILATHGAHLPAAHRAAFAATIDDPPAPRRHQFPEHAKLCSDAAKPLVDAKRYADAEPMLRRAVELDAQDEHVVELGFVLGQLGRYDDAIALYDRALGDRGSPLLRFNRANCLLRMQRFDAAVDDYRICVDAIPQRPDLRVNLVSALHASGNTPAARDELAILRSRGGVSPEIVRGLEQMLGSSMGRSPT